MAPYTNKRNRFIYKVKDYLAANPSVDSKAMSKTVLTEIAQSIGMKHMPSWVAKEFKAGKDYDLSSLVATAGFSSPPITGPTV